MCDFTGGSLSLFQLCLEVHTLQLARDWNRSLIVFPRDEDQCLLWHFPCSGFQGFLSGAGRGCVISVQHISWHFLCSIINCCSCLPSASQATVMRDVSLITGDPVKFGLGFVSLFYDLVLMTQHFIIYAPTHASDKAHAPPRRKVGTYHVTLVYLYEWVMPPVRRQKPSLAVCSNCSASPIKCTVPCRRRATLSMARARPPATASQRSTRRRCWRPQPCSRPARAPWRTRPSARMAARPYRQGMVIGLGLGSGAMLCTSKGGPADGEPACDACSIYATGCPVSAVAGARGQHGLQQALFAAIK